MYEHSFGLGNVLFYLCDSGLFEWKEICAGFFSIPLIYVLLLEIHLSREEGSDLINQSNAPYLYACPKPGPGFQLPYATDLFFIFSELK